MSKPASPAAPIGEFVPSNITNMDDLLKGLDPIMDTPPAPAEPVAPVPPVAPVIPEPVTPPEGDDLPPGDIKEFKPATPEPEPAPTKPNAMREQLKKLAEEKAAIEAEATKLKQEREAEAAEIVKLRADYDEQKKKYDELSVKSSMGNPMEHPAIQQIIAPWGSRVEGVKRHMAECGIDPESANGTLNTMIQKYVDAGDPGSDTFKENMKDIRDQIDLLTDDLDPKRQALMAGELMSAVRDGANIGLQVRATVQQMQQDAPAFHYQQQMAAYSHEEREYAQMEQGFFNPTEDVKIGDPFNNSVIIRAMIDGSEEVKKAAETAKRFSRMVLLPPKPLSPQDLELIEPEKRGEAVLAHRNRHLEAQKRAKTIFAEAVVARALLPALWKEIDALKRQIKGDRGGPRPRLEGDQLEQEPTTPASPRDFVPVSPDLSKIPLQ